MWFNLSILVLQNYSLHQIKQNYNPNVRLKRNKLLDTACGVIKHVKNNKISHAHIDKKKKKKTFMDFSAGVHDVHDVSKRIPLATLLYERFIHLT